jgi:parvulin-like peptidyl-prolyl isomerase
MKFKWILALFLIFSGAQVNAQKMTIAQMKANIEKAPNPVAYVRDVLKKKYKLDTITIANSTSFSGIADSLAYKGKQRKVYGPYDGKYLVQILGKAPNEFTRISQIFIDTSTITLRIADSLANNIISRLRAGASFEDMAQSYSMGGEARTKGDLGWIARGSIMPEIEKEIKRHKKGEVFKLWSRTGLHIIKRTSEPKEDAGFVLMLRVIL